MDREEEFERFYDILWGERITDDVVSTEYLSSNTEFINEITRELFKSYEAGFKMEHISKLTEIFFNLTFKFKPFGG